MKEGVAAQRRLRAIGFFLACSWALASAPVHGDPVELVSGVLIVVMQPFLAGTASAVTYLAAPDLDNSKIAAQFSRLDKNGELVSAEDLDTVLLQLATPFDPPTLPGRGVAGKDMTLAKDEWGTNELDVFWGGNRGSTVKDALLVAAQASPGSSHLEDEKSQSEIRTAAAHAAAGFTAGTDASTTGITLAASSIVSAYLRSGEFVLNPILSPSALNNSPDYKVIMRAEGYIVSPTGKRDTWSLQADVLRASADPHQWLEVDFDTTIAGLDADAIEKKAFDQIAGGKVGFSLFETTLIEGKDFTYSQIASLFIVPVHEHSTLLLLGVGLAGLAAWPRRRQGT